MRGPFLMLALLFSVSMSSGAWAQPEPDGPRLRDAAAEWDLRIGAISRSGLVSTPNPSTDYQRVLDREFNILTPEGAMKWYDLQPTKGDFDWEEADRHRAFAEANGMALHGHVLVWPHYAEPPGRSSQGGWLGNETCGTNGDNIRTLIETHIEAVMERFGGSVAVWDVVNEPILTTGAYKGDGSDPEYDNTFYECLPPKPGETVPEYIKVAFEKAAEVRKDNGWTDMKLIINDIGALNRTPAMQATYRTMLQEMISEGIEIDGLGLQFHRGLEHFNPTEQARWVNFATEVSEMSGTGTPDEGLGIWITELDVKAPGGPSDFDEQADAYAEALERFLHVPNRQAFQLWGFTDRHSWRNPDKYFDCYYPLIFYGTGRRGSTTCSSAQPDYTAKPAYYHLQRVLQGGVYGTARESNRNVFQTIQAESHDAQHGARTMPENDPKRVGYFDDGDYIKFARVDFGTGADRVRVRYATPNAGTRALVFLIDSDDGDPLTWTEVGRLQTQSTGGWGSYEEHEATLTTPVSGIHTLYVQADGGNAVANIDWFRFESSGGGGAGCASAGTPFRLRNRQNDRYAYGASNADSNGDEIRLRPAESWSSMEWSLVDNGDGWYRLKNLANDTFAYGADNADSNGDLLELRTAYEGWQSMQWRFESVGGDWYRLRNRANGLFAWGAGQSTGTNTTVKLRGDETWTSLQWTCDPVGGAQPRTGTISSAGLPAPGPYPNPASGTVQLVVHGEAPALAVVRVYDVLGRGVLEGRAAPRPLGEAWEMTLQLGALPPGVYVYRIGADSETHTTGRFTIAR